MRVVLIYLITASSLLACPLERMTAEEVVTLVLLGEARGQVTKAGNDEPLRAVGQVILNRARKLDMPRASNP